MHLGVHVYMRVTVVPVATATVKEMRIGKLPQHCVLFYICPGYCVCILINFGSVVLVQYFKQLSLTLVFLRFRKFSFCLDCFRELLF